VPGRATSKLTLGIEEEYLLVARESRDLVAVAPTGFLASCERRIGKQVTPELMQSQVEVGTVVCGSIAEARAELARLRRAVIDAAAEHGCAILAASTHPFAQSREQRHTPRQRYERITSDLQEVARRLVIGGMHVHIGVPDPERRIELLAQSTYILPHLLALSTSSPFWEGHETGLYSYRIAVLDELPRTGLPEPFGSDADYQRYLDTLVRTGLIDDASKIWWDIRPSARFPTLEMRITDVCTRLDDAICVAAIFVCWVRMLERLRRSNQGWRRYSALLIGENRWLAQRHGCERGLLDLGRRELVPFAELIEEMLVLIAPEMAELDCAAEVEHARKILARGTSAHLQLRTQREALARGASEREALFEVVDALIRETEAGS
jgi:carboxylate-amine ligase